MTIAESLQLALRLHQAGRTAEAEKLYRQVLTLQPNHPDALHLLGVLANQTGRFQEGFDLISRVVAIHPEAEFYLNLGASLNGLNRTDEAIAAFSKAVSLKPDYAKAHYNLGNSFHNRGNGHEAISAYRKAISFRPDDADTHWNLALDLLAEGDFENGWKEYEWRWQVKGLRLGHRIPGKVWNGGDLTGRRILLHTEQGFGDAIQFVRYVPQVAARNGKIILFCQSELRRLFGCVPHVEQWITADEPLPEFDVCCPLLTLPGILGTTPDNIPAPVPYLRADQELSSRFRSRIPTNNRLKVGLAWANRPLPPNRCPPVAEWAALADVSGTWFCSLQKAGLNNESFAHPPGLHMTDWTDELHDFADTTALIDCLDLVITIDTAVAHLAGAMGKPVWLLLKRVPDWRWMYERADSPWYPTMKLFRQPAAGDWATPMRQIRQSLMAIAV